MCSLLKFFLILTLFIFNYSLRIHKQSPTQKKILLKNDALLIELNNPETKVNVKLGDTFKIRIFGNDNEGNFWKLQNPVVGEIYKGENISNGRGSYILASQDDSLNIDIGGANEFSFIAVNQGTDILIFNEVHISGIIRNTKKVNLTIL